MTDFNPVRWGILGASSFALNFMGPAIHAACGADLVAIASRTEAKVAPFRAFAPHLKYHSDYDALLADPEIDAVYIPLPNHLHVQWAEKALRAGKAVLCEKPLAMTAGDFESLIALRDETGGEISEAFMIVHHPQWQRVRDLIAQGAIGDLKLVEAAFTYDNPDMENIRNKAETGGGGLRDIGVYTFGATRFATGCEPSKLAFSKAEMVNGVDVFASTVFEFDGFDLHSTVSTRMSRRQGMQFHGTKGVIRMPCPFNPLYFSHAELAILREGEPAMVEEFPSANQYVLQVEAFGAAMRGESDWPWPLERARGTQVMIDMALAAL